MWFSPRLPARTSNLAPRSQTRRRPRRAPLRPALEALGGRRVLSTNWVVANPVDDGSPGALRAEIAAAGSGDTVDLSGLGGQTITLNSGELVLNKSLTIQGPSDPNSPVTIDGNFSRIFEVDGTRTSV